MKDKPFTLCKHDFHKEELNQKQLVGIMWFNNFMANNKNIKHPKVSKTDIFKSFCQSILDSTEIEPFV